MSRRAIIDTPFPSLADTARAFGVSVAEAERVERMLLKREPGRRARANGHGTTLRYARKKASKKR